MKDTTKKRKNAVNVYRVSSNKQFLAGNSLEDQERACKAVNKRYEHAKVKEFELIETGAGEDRVEFQRVIDYCKNPKNKVDVVVIKSIDRFTRGGDVAYGILKNQLAKYGIKLIDAYGFIQPGQNTLSHLGIEYEWSKYSPSENAESMEANRAKQERRDILTRVIGAEILYTRQGYAVRQAPYGYMNKKIETQHGKRTIRVPHPTETKWIRKMFSLRAGGMKDQEIVEKLNGMGFKTRIQNVRDRRTRVVVGHRGGKPLTVKQLQRFIIKPIYAGYIVERWTNYQPVKARFSGLVSVDLFNQANKGKVVIVEDDIEPRILKNQKPRQRFKHNPDYPFKAVRCPTCGQPLLASAPRNGSGKRRPYYHCSRGHPHWGVAKATFEQTIFDFINDLDFTDDFIKLFKEVCVDVWNKKRADALEESQNHGRRVLDLEAEKQSIITTMTSLSSPEALKAFESKLEEVGLELELMRRQRDTEAQKELDIEELVNYAGYLMERVDVLLIDTDNSEQQRCLFELIFDKIPTYDEIANRTVSLSRSFKLNQQPALSKTQMVNLYKIARSYYSEQVQTKPHNPILSKSATDRKLACDTAGF